MNKTKVIGILPARWGATRFPGKPLALIAGQSLIQRVWERSQQATRLAEIVIATDDERIAAAAANFGARAVMTSVHHQSGTDRVAEAVRRMRDPSISHVINIQGDEPTIDPALIDQLAETLQEDCRIQMITAACPLTDAAEFSNPNCVKVVLAQNGDALYFSRSPIPHRRADAAALPTGLTFLRHQGIYGYRRRFLAEFVRWVPSPLELTERLEQLRALEHGTRIRVVVTERESIGVDAPEDVARVEKILGELPTATP